MRFYGISPLLGRLSFVLLLNLLRRFQVLYFTPCRRDVAYYRPIPPFVVIRAFHAYPVMFFALIHFGGIIVFVSVFS